MEENKQHIQAGSLLISEPMMSDNYFKRAVVVIAEHNESGTVGFILNKVVDIKINEALAHFESFDYPLYFGGPVQRDNIFYIHTLGESIPGSTRIIDGLYWGGDFDTVTALIKSNSINESDIKFFIGYSGWDPYQLEAEITKDAWMISKATIGSVMTQSYKDLWGNVLKTMGNEFALLSNFPEYPQLN
jgi:putative transcriptional regulator